MPALNDAKVLLQDGFVTSLSKSSSAFLREPLCRHNKS